MQMSFMTYGRGLQIPGLQSNSGLRPVRSWAASEAHLSSTIQLPPPPLNSDFHETGPGAKKVGDPWPKGLTETKGILSCDF